MKIGILTFHRAHNYGAFLQACALCNRLNQEDNIDAEIIDYRMPAEKCVYETKHFPLKKKISTLLHATYFFYKHIEKRFNIASSNPLMKLSKNSLVSNSLDEFRNMFDGKYDVIVVGSDEVWKVDSYRGFPTAYWLFGNMHCKKVSYAASAMVKFEEKLTPDQFKKLKQALSDFDFIGVRDNYTKKEIESLQGITAKVHLCCDPTFLFEFNIPNSDIFERIACKKGYDTKLPTMVVMLDNEEAAKYIKNVFEKKYNLISVFRPHKGFINFPDADPFEWIYLIKHADFVISSFFHAICFSIIYDKAFIAVGTKKKRGKLIELLSDPVLKRRYVEIEENPDIESMARDILSSNDSFEEYRNKVRKTFDVFLAEINQLINCKS